MPLTIVEFGLPLISIRPHRANCVKITHQWIPWFRGRYDLDMLWTLTRFPNISDLAWEQGRPGMERELLALKARHES